MAMQQAPGTGKDPVSESKVGSNRAWILICGLHIHTQVCIPAHMHIHTERQTETEEWRDVREV